MRLKNGWASLNKRPSNNMCKSPGTGFVIHLTLPIPGFVLVLILAVFGFSGDRARFAPSLPFGLVNLALLFLESFS